MRKYVIYFVTKRIYKPGVFKEGDTSVATAGKIELHCASN